MIKYIPFLLAFGGLFLLDVGYHISNTPKATDRADRITAIYTALGTGMLMLFITTIPTLLK